MQLGVYSLITPDYNIQDTAALIAEIGYTGVEWAVDYPKAVWDGESNWHISTLDLDATVEAARSASEAHGLTIVGLGTRCNCFELEKVRDYMGVARKVGSPTIRVMAPGYDGKTHIDELLAKARDAFAKVESMARDSGIRALLELHHGLIVPSASAARRLLDGCDPQWVGAMYDPGNMINEGMENWKMAAEILGPYLQHVHVKSGGWVRGDDGRWRCEAMSLAEGMIDWQVVVDALKSVGYDGYLDLEDLRGGWACVPVGITTREKLQQACDHLTPML
jgi:sugar phosphate isomerase/epimerase